MKKILFSIGMLFSVVMLFNIVNAVEISPNDIPAGTYLIGTHLFSRNTNDEYNGTLTVKHIMLAAKTITGNKLSDMKILYKRASDNAWVDALTNEKVTLASKVEVVYENTKIYSETLYGDVDYNGKVEKNDVTLLLSYINGKATLTEGQLIAADVNGDGEVNKVDVYLLDGYNSGYFKNTLPNKQITDYILYGDVLGDGELSPLESGAAYSVIEQYLNGNTSYLEGQALKNADINGDGKVDNIDKSIMYGYINGYIDENALPSLVPFTTYTLYGDIDNNGIVNKEDVALLEEYLDKTKTVSEQGLKNSDMNNDGNVNDDDYAILIQYLVSGTKLPFFLPKQNVTKVEYYALNDLLVNEYLITVPSGVNIEWNGEPYEFSDDSVIYDVALFNLPKEFDQLERFKGWYKNAEGTIAFDASQSLTGTTTLYAVFDKDLTVYYDGNGKTSGEMMPSTFVIGEAKKLSKNSFERSGYKFLGWAEEANSQTVKYTDEVEIEFSLEYLAEPKTSYVLYAVWEKTIILGDVTGDGEVNSSDSNAIMKYIDENKELTSEQLIAADVNEDGEVDDLDHIIISKYVAKLITSLPYDSGSKYTITYDLNDGKEDENSFERYYGVYAEICLPYTLPTPVKEGFVFEGWTGSNGTTPQKEVTITSGTTGNLTYTANWKSE